MANFPEAQGPHHVVFQSCHHYHDRSRPKRKPLTGPLCGAFRSQDCSFVYRSLTRRRLSSRTAISALSLEPTVATFSDDWLVGTLRAEVPVTYRRRAQRSFLTYTQVDETCISATHDGHQLPRACHRPSRIVSSPPVARKNRDEQTRDRPTSA